VGGEYITPWILAPVCNLYSEGEKFEHTLSTYHARLPCNTACNKKLCLNHSSGRNQAVKRMWVDTVYTDC